jgi:hypothetical protein
MISKLKSIKEIDNEFKQRLKYYNDNKIKFKKLKKKPFNKTIK